MESEVGYNYLHYYNACTIIISNYNPTPNPGDAIS